MQQATFTDLSNLGLLCVAGADAKKLLQGQLTCDMNDVTQTFFILGAHCNPQGRIISLFRIFMFQDHYYLQMPRESISFALAALKKYAVFFKVSLENVSDTFFQIGYCGDNAHLPDTIALQKITHRHTNRSILLGDIHLKNILLEKLSKTAKAENLVAWKQLEIKEGIPAIYPATTEKFLPHEINLPALHGVSFHKGCFTGQEIIARMQYRGKLKTHLYSATIVGVTEPKHGALIYTNEGPAGHIVDFVEVGYTSYALLVTANESDIGTKTFFIDSAHKITLELSSWQKN